MLITPRRPLKFTIQSSPQFINTRKHGTHVRAREQAGRVHATPRPHWQASDSVGEAEAVGPLDLWWLCRMSVAVSRGSEVAVRIDMMDD